MSFDLTVMSWSNALIEPAGKIDPLINEYRATGFTFGVNCSGIAGFSWFTVNRLRRV